MELERGGRRGEKGVTETLIVAPARSARECEPTRGGVLALVRSGGVIRDACETTEPVCTRVSEPVLERPRVDQLAFVEQVVVDRSLQRGIVELVPPGAFDEDAGAL